MVGGRGVISHLYLLIYSFIADDTLKFCVFQWKNLDPYELLLYFEAVSD